MRPPAILAAAILFFSLGWFALAERGADVDAESVTKRSEATFPTANTDRTDASPLTRVGTTLSDDTDPSVILSEADLSLTNSSNDRSSPTAPGVTATNAATGPIRTTPNPTLTPTRPPARPTVYPPAYTQPATTTDQAQISAPAYPPEPATTPRSTGFPPAPYLPTHHGLAVSSADSTLTAKIAGASAGIHAPEYDPEAWQLNNQQFVKQKSAYWMVGTTALGLYSTANRSASRWSRTPEATTVFDAVIDGVATPLHYVATEESTSNQFNVIHQVHLLRQTGGGLLYGVGYALLNDRSSNVKFAQSLSTSDENFYYLASDEQAKYSLVTTTVGFTFLRSRRYQPWISVNANVPVASRNIQRRYFVGGAEGTTHLQDRRTQTIARRDISPKIFPSLQVGVRGQLGRRLRVGVTAGLVPTNIDISVPIAAGLDVHYVFGR